MAEKIRSLLKYLDIPSGSVLGVYTGMMIILTAILALKGKDIGPNLLMAYLGVVGAKTGHSIFKPKEVSNAAEVQTPPPVIG